MNNPDFTERPEPEYRFALDLTAVNKPDLLSLEIFAVGDCNRKISSLCT